jgi:hypothetical protein
MRHTKLVVVAAALMVAMLVALAVPAMARDRNFDRFDRFDRDPFFNRFDPFFNRFDPFDNGFNNGFGDFEQDADSGDISQSFNVSGEGNNSNQCVGITGNANTGNAQNQTGVTDFGNFGTFNDFDRFDRNRFDHHPFFFDGFNGNGDDFGFDNTGADLTVTGTSTTSCDQQVNQAAAAG